MNFKQYHVSKNLFDGTLIGGIFQDTNFTVSGSTTVYKSIKIYLTVGNYTLSWVKNVNIVRLIIDGTYTENVETDVMTYTFTINNSGYFGITFRDSTSSSTVWDDSPIMLNTGSQPLPYEPYGNTWHDIPHYIHNTSTDTITTPADIYANNTTATVGLKGDMSQSGTPSPSSPIYPQETGDKTANLWDKGVPIYAYVSDYKKYNSNNAIALKAGTYTISSDGQPPTIQVFDVNHTQLNIDDTITYTSSYYKMWDGLAIGPIANTIRVITITLLADCILTFAVTGNPGTYIMLNEGSTALPYEPYGYKIPISSASTTTPVYLGEVQSIRKIVKVEFSGNEDWQLVESSPTNRFFNIDLSRNNFPISMTSSPSVSAQFDSIIFVSNGTIIRIYDNAGFFTTETDFKTYLQQQYAAGTPVCVWYVLSEPTTGIVNEPIRKIGDYADEVSGISIPTIAGANTLSIGTTLQPSEVTVTYKGWHPVADAHEAENGQWD